MVRENIAWVDWLRIIACFVVVLAHCVDPFVAQLDNNYSDFFAGALWGSFARPCVPLFIMVSGLLLLPVGESMGVFYKKRLSRVVIPLAVWSIVTPVLFYLYVNYAGTIHPGLNVANYTSEGMMSKMWTWILNFNYDVIPLWYVYMLVGIYLILPIISSWLREASKSDMKKFLGLWIFSMCIPYLTALAPLLGYQALGSKVELFGMCDWSAYGTFYYFSGFLGYVVLAFYLKKFPLEWSSRKTFAMAIPMFLVGYAITAVGFVKSQEMFPGNFLALELVWYFCGINVFLMTLSSYLMLSRIKAKSNPIVSKIAGLTFGIYLTHFLFVHIAYDLLYWLPIPAALKIPIMGTAAFVVVLALVWLLSKLPWRKYIVG